jgi:hypothetical protein
MRRHTVPSALLPGLLLTIVAPLWLSAQEVPAGRRLAITERAIHLYNAVGRVTVRRGSGSTFAVTAHARGAEASRLRFAVDRAGDSVVFRTIYPDVDAIAAPEWLSTAGGNQGTTLRLRRDGTFGGDGGRGRWWSRERGAEVEIGTRDGLRGWAEIEVEVPEGRALAVHLAVGEADIEGVTADGFVDLWSARARARTIAGRWLFDTGSGDVEVRGARGQLRIDTGSGRGTVEGMRGDLLDIDTGSGDVDVTDVEVERFRFDTGSGDVQARNLRARRGVADTGSGDVDLDLAGAALDDLLIDTGSGRVSLRLPQAADARLTVDTGSGDVAVERAGGVFERRGERGVVLRFGDGRARIRIDTGSGGVTIR